MASKLYQPQDISGWTVLITGASSGFGEACAWRFAELNCKLILIARRLEKLQALEQQLTEKYKVNIHVIQLDVQDQDRVEQLSDELPENFKSVDVLINNAGLALGFNACYENDMNDVRTVFNTNVMAVFALTKSIVPGMIERGRGHIVNMSSIAGQEAYVGASAYCATKFAVGAMTIAARHDLVGTPIRVTCLCPGAAKTGASLVRCRGDKAKADAVYEGFVPLNAHDIADNVVYVVTRPSHVQIADMTILATAQSSARGIARNI
eukprot:TRINITY_DN1460_c0_g2_i2.p1 TRINITY_DN1460_c0_g2~~TRINITY_DN1460_c0_g2_i2.p1  ORF type:complete len:265 (+),score=21.23 TRINITY_DN1460_c0_g2_i2:185-979(+)